MNEKIMKKLSDAGLRTYSGYQERGDLAPIMGRRINQKEGLATH